MVVGKVKIIGGYLYIYIKCFLVDIVTILITSTNQLNSVLKAINYQKTWVNANVNLKLPLKRPKNTPKKVKNIKKKAIPDGIQALLDEILAIPDGIQTLLDGIIEIPDGIIAILDEI